MQCVAILTLKTVRQRHHTLLLPTKSMDALLEEARDILGEELHKRCTLGWQISNVLADSSCMEAAEALAAVCMPKREMMMRLGVHEKSTEGEVATALLKAVKKAARDVLLWRCIGKHRGLDRSEALFRFCEEIVRGTRCDENVVTQLRNAWARITQDLQRARNPQDLTGFTGPRPAGPTLVMPGPVPSPQVAELPALADDNTYLKNSLDAILNDARHILFPTTGRADECRRRWNRSNEIIVESCVEIAKVLAALDESKKEQLQDLKTALQNVLLWHSVGSTLGLDSKKALVRHFEVVCAGFSNCNELVAKLTIELEEHDEWFMLG
jgi:hypothetical protein